MKLLCYRLVFVKKKIERYKLFRFSITINLDKNLRQT